MSSNSSSNSSWTGKQNKLFEDALATYENTPEWWQKVAKAIGKNVEEVKRHYQKLVEDIKHIESGKVPVPNYNSCGNNSNTTNRYKMTN